LIDIIMSTREGKVIRCTEADDRNAWDDTSHSMEPGWLFISQKSKSNKKTFVLSYPDD
jgi:hypothetical protein